MKKLLVTLVMLTGCSDTERDEIFFIERQPARPGVPPPDAPECVFDRVVETVLPTVNPGDLVALCTSCDVGGCDSLGAACDLHGRPCDADGQVGVCVACCNGEVGELHCSPVH